MKVDSEYLDIDLLPEREVQDTVLKRGKKVVRIWEDGEVYFEYGDDDICVTVKELEEIVRIAKLFKSRRDFYLANKS